jgi:hypothetical protein
MTAHVALFRIIYTIPLWSIYGLKKILNWWCFAICEIINLPGGVIISDDTPVQNVV